MDNMGTPFSVIFSAFLSKVTDDMYGETWTEIDLKKDLENIMIAALPGFKYPKFPISRYVRAEVIPEFETAIDGYFEAELTDEEVEIIAKLMIIEWMVRQLATYENTKQKVYSSSDFKISSQANHMDKLLKVRQHFIADARTAQDRYGRRTVDKDGYVRPNFSALGGGVL